MKKVVSILTVLLFGLASHAQGSLQFNQVLLINAASGQVTVPANKVWKITSQGTSGGVYYENWASNQSVTWSLTNPHPCSGATSGSTTVRYLYKRSCSFSNNLLIINGIKSKMGATGPIWLSAGTTLSVSATPCVNTLSPDMPANSPYYVQDLTSSTTYYYECAGAINAGVVPNSILASIIEFNIIP
jgi:hypothetical protein